MRAHWTDVADRLPEPGQYLVTFVDEQNRPPHDRHVSTAHFDGTAWQGEWQVAGLVVAWQPLPEPAGGPYPRRVHVWSEGYEATGESGGPSFHGTVELATSLHDACRQLAARDRRFRVHYDPATDAYWACRLYAGPAPSSG